MSKFSRGRLHPDRDCPVRTAFQQDRDRILHSVSFRNLKFKTNVFLSTKGEKFRTRLTHALEVSQLGRTIARALSLNEDLVEAISLGHDLGHTSYGHVGEDVLKKLTGGKFSHSQQSLRVVDVLEKDGKGLNLTAEVRDGILKHTKGPRSMKLFDGTGEFGKPLTLEGQIVQFADWLAYINHDVDDAVTMKIVKASDFPRSAMNVLGRRQSQRLDTMVRDLITASRDLSAIHMSPEILEATEEVRHYLYGHVYTHPKIADELLKAKHVITMLFEYYMKHFDKVMEEWPWADRKDTMQTVTDFVAWQSDYSCLERYETIRASEPYTVIL